MLDVLARALRRQLERIGPKPGQFDRIDGLELIDRLILVDQTPIGRTPRSTPATYTGVFDEIRKLFTRTREAKIRGYKASRFSFNVKGGRCEVCQGQGQRRIAMQFLPDLHVRCEACGGKRFNRQTLDARYKGASIGDVLEMRVDEALAFFDAVPRIQRGLDALHDAGLGYVTLGQSSTTLSGGEAQRIKLAAELGRAATGRTLYILDEPTTGLHFADVDNLMRVLNRLADAGNTLVVIEHNLDVLRGADWIIDLGPEGGAAGGHIVAMGRLADVIATPESHTGRYLLGKEQSGLLPPDASPSHKSARRSVPGFPERTRLGNDPRVRKSDVAGVIIRRHDQRQREIQDHTGNPQGEHGGQDVNHPQQGRIDPEVPREGRADTEEHPPGQGTSYLFDAALERAEPEAARW